MPDILFEYLGKEIPFSHKELCMFARAAIMHRAGLSLTHVGGMRHIFGPALRDATHKLKELGIEFSELAPWVAPNIFNNGFASLDQPARNYLLLSLRHCWLFERPIEKPLEPEQVARMAEVAREWATARKLSSNPSARDLQAFAEFLRLPSSGEHQAILRNYVGDYLVFRRLRTTLQLSVSHMRVIREGGDASPATYVTTTFVPGGETRRPDIVKGAFHVAPGNSGVIFATGQHEGTGQVRLSILQPRSKPDYDTEDLPNDLTGLRLSLSEGTPEGYHVWCSRIAGKQQPPMESLQTISRAYDLLKIETATEKVIRLSDEVEFKRQHDCQPQEWFEMHVVGLRGILAYLDDKPIVSMN